MKRKSLFLLLAILFLSLTLAAQNEPLTQTIRGTVTDRASGVPLGYVTVQLVDLSSIGGVTGDDGQFELTKVPLGRHTVKASLTGYDPTELHEILVTSAKETVLSFSMNENIRQLEEVVVRPSVNKEQPMNKMALSGGRMLSVEEAARYAGGMDDPARLVSSFAGVAAGMTTNGISIHGNAPHLLQWRLEDVEVPNPNHFSDISVLGGGILSSLSSHVLGNSDFFTGAFPSEYGNALSGVFDMKLRNGNNRQYEHTFQLGILGIDFASEGPISRKHHSSYIVNYRYSTTGLMGKIFPQISVGGTLDYQDLNFKLNFPTSKAGVFSLWGTALKDKVKPILEDVDDWKYADDGILSSANQKTMAAGAGYRYFFGSNTLWKTTFAYTYSHLKTYADIYDRKLDPVPYRDAFMRYGNVILTSSLNHKFASWHTHQTGLTVSRLRYDMRVDASPDYNAQMVNVAEANGNTYLASAYTNSSVMLSNRFTVTLGLNAQVLTLNRHWTIEPRMGAKWQASRKSSFAFGYGLHSQMERLNAYFVKGENDGLPNKNLDFTKAHHFTFAYNYKLSENKNLRIEPYFQYLYDVPVIADSSYSVLNRSAFYVDNVLVNEGNGRNYGIDITFEKYLSRGLYYMITGSVFDSKYRGGNGVWHDTKFNRRYIVNGLIGKEWIFGRKRQHILGANIRLTVQGGHRYTPVDEEASLRDPGKTMHYDESRAYSEQFAPLFIAHYTFSYKLNMERTAHEFAVKGINLTQSEEYYGHEYNLKTLQIEPKMRATSLVNISYKIEF